VKRCSSLSTLVARFLVLAAAVISVGACGDLDNVTTVKDLRVLAVKAEPAGFLVPLDDPRLISATTATLTALVVDPKGEGATLTISGSACPDYVDTITAASGKSSTLCPGREITDQFPPPFNEALATTTLIPNPSRVPPLAPSTIAYEPQVFFGLQPDTQLAYFFSPTPSGVPAIDQSVQYNRDFGFDAIVDLDFTLRAEKASVIKRVVYWPLLPPDLVPDDPNCPPPQVANRNPVIATLDLYQHRVEGDPMDPWANAVPTLSLATKDELFVQPTYDAASAEHYLLRVSNSATGLVETQCRHELLTFQFYATAGTFEPEFRQSELPPFFTTGDGKVHLDSQYKLPKPEDVPADGRVTIWVVVRDERAGTSWATATINVTN
jgi:hypothetical protein